MRDEHYIINLCNKVLGSIASQQYRFDFLRGDKLKKINKNNKVVIEIIQHIGVKLPVDAYYEKFNLVVEYHERQHLEPVKHFDKRMTCSGVSRGEQRKIYDQRRRDVLPKKGIILIELRCIDFKRKGKNKLARDEKEDELVIRKKLKKFLESH